MINTIDEKIKSIKIESSESILTALNKMDDTFKRLLLVFENDQFKNILSIGDIQRAIIRDKPLHSSVNEILRKNTNMAHVEDSFEAIKETMLKNRAECMPVLDDNKQLVDVYFWEDLFSEDEPRLQGSLLNIPVVIMAGGKGSRLKPITNVLPKPLIPIGDKSILEHIMQRFRKMGCLQFYISLNYKADMIRHYVDHIIKPNYEIKFFEENKPLGTAGSLHLLKGIITQTFFVTNCDILIDDDYRVIYNYHVKNKNDLTIVAALKHFSIPYGTVETGQNGILKTLNEKPELTFKINSGMYIIEPEVIEQVPQNQFFHITDLIEKVKSRGGKIGVFPVSQGSWSDIGNWDEYLKVVNVNKK